MIIRLRDHKAKGPKDLGNIGLREFWGWGNIELREHRAERTQGLETIGVRGHKADGTSS